MQILCTNDIAGSIRTRCGRHKHHLIGICRSYGFETGAHIEIVGICTARALAILDFRINWQWITGTVLLTNVPNLNTTFFENPFQEIFILDAFIFSIVGIK